MPKYHKWCKRLRRRDLLTRLSNQNSGTPIYKVPYRLPLWLHSRQIRYLRLDQSQPPLLVPYISSSAKDPPLVQRLFSDTRPLRVYTSSSIDIRSFSSSSSAYRHQDPNPINPFGFFAVPVLYTENSSPYYKQSHPVFFWRSSL